LHPKQVGPGQWLSTDQGLDIAYIGGNTVNQSSTPTPAALQQLSTKLAATCPGAAVRARVVPRPADHDPARPITVEIHGAWGVDYLKVSAATSTEAADLVLKALGEVRRAPEEDQRATTRRFAPDVADALEVGDSLGAARKLRTWLEEER
jgi:hypothetical protein